MTEEFAAVYHDLEQGVTPLAYINAHLPIPSFSKRDKARVRMVEMISGVIRARRRDRRQGEDFLQTLMESRYSDGRALTENEITGMLLAGMFAGHHTSLGDDGVDADRAVAQSRLSRARGRGDRWGVRRRHAGEPRGAARADGDGERGQGGAAPAPAAVHAGARGAAGLHLQEVVRAQGELDRDLPDGVAPLESVFKNARAFDPDRFAPPREEDKRDFAYISFGGGRHKCLGNAFAILQIKAILALLLGQYEFELAGDKIDSDFQGLVVGPKEPCRVRYRKRAQPSVTMNAAAELSKLASPEAMAAAVELHGGASAHANGNGTNGNGTNGHATAKAPAKKLKITLDRDLCQGHAVCVGEAPDLFRIGEDGKVELALDGELPLGLYAKAHEAAQYCPTRTIKLRYE